MDSGFGAAGEIGDGRGDAVFHQGLDLPAQAGNLGLGVIQFVSGVVVEGHGSSPAELLRGVTTGRLSRCITNPFVPHPFASVRPGGFAFVADSGKRFASAQPIFYESAMIRSSNYLT
jgi:hypothetical protein